MDNSDKFELFLEVADCFNCESLGELPNNTVFVGDNPIADIDGANAVGMYTVYVSGYVGDTCEHANAICNDFSELIGIVEKAF